MISIKFNIISTMKINCQVLGSYQVNFSEFISLAGALVAGNLKSTKLFLTTRTIQPLDYLSNCLQLRKTLAEFSGI